MQEDQRGTVGIAELGVRECAAITQRDGASGRGYSGAHRGISPHVARLSTLDSGGSAQCTLAGMPRINATAACLLGLLQLGPAPGQPGYGVPEAGMTGS